MKRFLTGFGLGIAGIALALGLTLGALAVAGPDVGSPPAPPAFDLAGPRSPSPTPSPSDGKPGQDDKPRQDHVSPSDSPTRTATASPSVDDHGGSPGSDDGSDDSSDSDHDSDDD